MDDLLSNEVCDTLVERLSSQYLGQIVQILINLEHFEMACQELEVLLIAARSQTSTAGPVSLNATTKFRNNKKAAEKRIFEVVNSKIDDLIETAEYDWIAFSEPTEPSNYMQTLTRFLSNIMNSTLLGLPTEIKELIYFDALSHAANMILVGNQCRVLGLLCDERPAYNYLRHYLCPLMSNASIQMVSWHWPKTLNIFQPLLMASVFRS